MSPILPALLALIAMSPSAVAQSQNQSDSLRFGNECRIAQRIIATGRPKARSSWAYGLIRRCPDAGGALGSAWARALRGEELQDREYQSTTVSDARILRAALLVAADTRRAMTERRSALEVVTQLCRPGRSLAGVWSQAHNQYAGLGAVFDHDTVPGAEPIHDTDREAAIAALDQIVAKEPQSDIGAVSRHIARELRRP